MTPRVLILGCGPAGLFAAHAATQLGCRVDIFSKKRRSEMFGAQYLHKDIPGLTDGQQEFTVEYQLRGDLEHYLHKVYGDKIPDPGKITKEGLVGIYPAWDIRLAYLRAWELYHESIINVAPIGINGDMLWRMVSSMSSIDPYQAVVSTIPMPDLCRKTAHDFISRKVWAVGDAPERGIFAPLISAVGPNKILYDGTDEVGWYRASNIAGYRAVEWPYSADSLPRGGSEVEKPIKTNCNCLETFARLCRMNVIQVGRYGAWNRLGHAHQAYWRVREELRGIL